MRTLMIIFGGLVLWGALARRPGESIIDLLNRLDAAVEKAIDEQIYVDEING